MCRSINTRQRSKQGAALIETLLSTILLLAVVVFSIGICRGLNTRSRMLAADRTLAWMGGHLDFEPPSSSVFFGIPTVFDFFFPAPEKEAMARDALTSDEMARLIRHWHFRDTLENEGVVRFDTFEVETGLFSSADPEHFKTTLAEQHETMGGASGEDAGGDALVGDYAVSKKKTPYEGVDSEHDGISDQMGQVSSAGTQALDMVMDFITGTFHRYHVSISYGMPMTFASKAYGWLFHMDVGLVEKADMGQLSSKTEEQVYGYIRTAEGGCVMPALDIHAVKNSNPLVDTVKNIITKLLGMMKDEQQKLALYRPYDETDLDYEENPLVAIEQEELYALMAYEIHHLDDEHKHKAAEDVDDSDKKYWKDKKAW